MIIFANFVILVKFKSKFQCQCADIKRPFNIRFILKSLITILETDLESDEPFKIKFFFKKSFNPYLVENEYFLIKMALDFDF